MARSPARYTGGPAYSRPSTKLLKYIHAHKVGYTPSGTGVSYASYRFPVSGPRTSTSGKRSYRDSRGRIRWGKPSVVARYHRKRRAK